MYMVGMLRHAAAGTWIFALVQTALCQDVQHFRAPSFSVASLHDLDANGRDRLSAALRGQGFLSVVDIPEYAESEARALRAAVECLEVHQRSGRVELPDSSTRSTLAATAIGSSADGHLPEWAKEDCPGLASAAAGLRRTAGLAIGAVAAAADTLPGVRKARLSSLVDKGEHLEHFHRYQVADVRTSRSIPSSFEHQEDLGPATLELHTDAGLLLAMSPGLWFARAGVVSAHAEPVLEVQLQDGRTMPLSTQKGELLILVGQGLIDWLPDYQFRAAPHALRLSRNRVGSTSQVDPTVRAWYGRMVFPPKSFVVGRGVTFGTWHGRAQAALAGSREADTNSSAPLQTLEQVAGCLSPVSLTRRLQDLSGSCGAGQIYCWLQCTSVEHLQCGESAQCIDRFTDIPCETHGQGCEPKCVETAGEANILVSSAGVETVNGEYTPEVRSTASKWSYRQVEGTGEVAWSVDRQEWIIFDSEYEDGSTLYWCAEDRDEPWLCNFQAAEGVPTPVPSISALQASLLGGGDFCNGMITDMHMTGFLSSWDDMRSQSPCLVIWLTEWKIDSYAKFVMALIGSCIAGVVCEALLKLRSLESTRSPIKNPKLAALGKILLYTLHRAVGYLAMLLAMTYQTEIFLAVIVGLSLGYALFNMKHQVHEGETACCNTTVGAKTAGDAPGAGLKTEFDVKGMTCRACSSAVEKRLLELPGVRQAIVDHSIGKCELRYAAQANVDVGAAVSAIEELGYEARPLPQDPGRVPIL